VSESTNDVSGSGLVGMAGNVREWTREVEVNPAFQLSPKKPVSVGGSFLNPAQGAATRTWLDDRSVRANDLGFRILIEN
jgi:formylglycine-generating enzyme required for sulfatase activity